MKINKDSLKARVNNISKEYSISPNVVYNRFFFDAFLSRLSRSEYKDKFILKGGLYLSSILGIDNRSTMDIDFYIKRINMERSIIFKAIEEICSIELDDNITFRVLAIESIKEDDRYGGFQIKVQGCLESVRYEFGIDVATGDPITPSDKAYDYKCLVSKEVLSLRAYSLETVISEKLQTVLSRGITNSRSKDYYDLFIALKTPSLPVDKKTLKTAFENTCKYRQFSISKNEALSLIDAIENNEIVKKHWKVYCDKNKYATNINFNDVILTIKFLIEIVY